MELTGLSREEIFIKFALALVAPAILTVTCKSIFGSTTLALKFMLEISITGALWLLRAIVGLLEMLGWVGAGWLGAGVCGGAAGVGAGKGFGVGAGTGAGCGLGCGAGAGAGTGFGAGCDGGEGCAPKVFATATE